LDDTIDGNGLEIDGVRINEPRSLDAGATIEKRIGAPSRRPNVREAIKKLVDEDENFLSRNRESKHADIRKTVHKLFPNDRRDDKGLGEDVLDQELKRIQKAPCATSNSEKR
jgi:hypothetical protein